MHPTDDLTTRGALMVARAAAAKRATLTDEADAHCFAQIIDRLGLEWAPSRGLVSRGIVQAIREVSASDARLARAIDAVPAEPINGPRIARYFAETI